MDEFALVWLSSVWYGRVWFGVVEFEFGLVEDLNENNTSSLSSAWNSLSCA